MNRSTLLALVCAALWMGACYALRFGLMENQHWVNVCDANAGIFACDARRILGLVIHFRVLSWTALILAGAAFALRGANGVRVAWIALFAGILALVLYTATPASFALLIAGLRLARSVDAGVTPTRAAVQRANQ